MEQIQKAVRCTDCGMIFPNGNVCDRHDDDYIPDFNNNNGYMISKHKGTNPPVCSKQLDETRRILAGLSLVMEQAEDKVKIILRARDKNSLRGICLAYISFKAGKVWLGFIKLLDWYIKEDNDADE